MITIKVYFKGGIIEKYVSKFSLEFILTDIRKILSTDNIKLSFNGNEYNSQDIQQVAIFEENIVTIIKRKEV